MKSYKERKYVELYYLKIINKKKVNKDYKKYILIVF